MSILRSLLSLITGTSPAQPVAAGMLTQRQLIQRESLLGRELFGPVPSDHRREFFCLDAHTWVWYEEWIDVDTGRKQALTTRYEVHENGILKAVNASYKFIDGEELQNFYQAVRSYYERSMREVYGKDPYTRQPLASPAV